MVDEAAQQRNSFFSPIFWGAIYFCSVDRSAMLYGLARSCDRWIDRDGITYTTYCIGVKWGLSARSVAFPKTLDDSATNRLLFAACFGERIGCSPLGSLGPGENR